MDREYLFYKHFKKIFFSVFILFTSCAPDSKNFAEHFGYLQKKEDYKVVSIFFIKDNIFTMKCDPSGNQLMMKFYKKENKWKKSKYISKGCNINSKNYIKNT